MASQAPSSSAEDPGSGLGPVPHTAFKAVGGAPNARWGGSTPSPLRTTGDVPLTLGTAGHIDHGKTALVRALTGVDTDRLAEERRRGISIVLGFASLALPSGRSVSVVDVPGHERFVRTMVAGATGIDLFVLVIAADDGVMPQTREHAAVLDALGVEHGVVAVTKADLGDADSAALQAHELMPGHPVVVCSAKTGVGLDELSLAIDDIAVHAVSRASRAGEALLHIDRVFTVPGRGVVVTGTLWSGGLSVGDAVLIHPGEGKARIRGLEVHGTAVEDVGAGQRVAVNLGGIKAGAVRRGDALAAAGTLDEATTLDCALTLEGARHGEQVHVHHGTRDVPGRLVALGDGLWQLRLARPLLARDGDRVVVRRSSPPDTLGGGTILDAAARRHGRNPDILDRLRRRRDGLPAPVVVPPQKLDPPRPVSLSPAAVALDERLQAAGVNLLGPGDLGDQASTVRELQVAGRAVRVHGRLYAHRNAVFAVRQAVIAAIEREGELTLSAIRDELGISRRLALAFLEYLDDARVTRRLPDNRRVLGARASEWRTL